MIKQILWAVVSLFVGQVCGKANAAPTFHLLREKTPDFSSYSQSLADSSGEDLIRFLYISRNKKIPAYPENTQSPCFDIMYAYPKAIGTGEKAMFLNKEIRSLLGFNAMLSFAKGVNEQFQKQIIQYKHFARDAKKSEDEDGFSLDWFSLMQIRVDYNMNGFVQLKVIQRGYTGGAHGQQSEGDLIYDMTSERLCSLSDITTMDSVQLQRLIETQFRKDNKLRQEDSLNGLLFYNYLVPTNNISFNQRGIQFIYNPYEVGPYTLGIFKVLVPYGKLKGALLPEFKERIHL